ncbi:MAG: beta-lactamase family protein [Clostridia bacterium]|nr:beta-lactamase family protein [Clostridia bacterium]
MDFTKLEKYLDVLPELGIPVSDTAVTLGGKTVFRHSAGYADAETKRPITNDDLYYVFSVSKITACVAAMRLVEEGKIALDDPVSKYLPAYAYLTVKDAKGNPVPAQNVMTVLHLFTMTGGLNYKINTAPIVRIQQSSEPTTLRLVNAFAEMPLEFEPGTRYLYSLCHDVLAAVVEVASGMRFADYVQKYIFDPLEMKNTGYHLPEELRPRLWTYYTYTNQLMTATPAPVDLQYILSDVYDSGGAGLYSSVDDQIKLMTALACGGTSPNGYRLLKPETVNMMTVNRLPDCARPQFGVTRLFGYGWGLCGRVHVNPLASNSRSTVGEFGWDGATGSYALVDTQKQLALYFGTHVRSCNYVYHTVHPMVRDLTYEALEK